MEEFCYTRVVEWIDEENLVPGIIQFDPFYMLKSLYGGWWAEADGSVTLIMPDYVILDTSVDVQFNHFIFDKNYKPSVSVAVTLGEDVALAKAVAIQGTDYEAALEGILENEDAVDITESGDVTIPLPADAETGKWSVVVAAFSEDGESYKAGEAAYVSFNFVKAGDTPDPATFEYGPEDIVDAISKEDLLATQWNLYASYYDEEAEDYSLIEKLGGVTISDLEDAEDAEEDVVLVKGMSAGVAEEYGFDDTMPFEYYEGVIYSLTYEKKSFKVGDNTYFVEPEIGYAANGEHDASAEDPYLMLGGLVSDNILAFVATDEYASYGVSFDGSLYWSAYAETGDEEEPYSSLGDILELVNPRLVAGGAEAAEAPASPLHAIKKSFSQRSNYVETERAYLQRCIKEHVLPKNINLRPTLSTSPVSASPVRRIPRPALPVMRPRWQIPSLTLRSIMSKVTSEASNTISTKSITARSPIVVTLLPVSTRSIAGVTSGPWAAPGSFPRSLSCTVRPVGSISSS